MGENEIFSCGVWSVRERAVAGGEWRSFVVRKMGGTTRRREKRNYWIGWNGQRFARNADTRRLSQDLPNVLDELEKFLEAN